MAHPAHILFRSATCNATEDYLGSDELYAVAGGMTFHLGSFTAGQSRSYDAEKTLPVGTTTLEVYERDLPPFDDDDLLGRADLTIDMDQDRTVSFQGDDADYRLTFKVISEPDI